MAMTLMITKEKRTLLSLLPANGSVSVCMIEDHKHQNRLENLLTMQPLGLSPDSEDQEKGLQSTFSACPHNLGDFDVQLV